ncbi:MAG: hypothetical protein LRY66_08250 [Saccharospirillaceae bacterium]|nr:hypothetical protein [Saccharospirillaceae bacterium]MCD8531342.1 hypothetical protein [Saccharospirillaceae bacterium]
MTAHEKPVSFFGSSQVGYIVLDPDTGAGAYLIGGGENGGFLDSDLEQILTYAGFVIGLAGAAFSAPLLVFISAVIAIALLVDLILDDSTLNHRCAGLGYIRLIAVAAAIASIFFPPLMAIVLLYVGLLAGNGTMSVAQSRACQN